MKPLHLAALAEDELREAKDWYETRTLGTGKRLINAVNMLLEQIRENPHLYPVVHDDIHRALVARFPHGVFYRELPDVILVIGVVHLHRHPDTWKRR